MKWLLDFLLGKCRKGHDWGPWIRRGINTLWIQTGWGNTVPCRMRVCRRCFQSEIEREA